jgi:hypothetical protein
MPLLGSGIIPSGPIGNELAAITRRSYVPKIVVQIYQATPVASAALANAQTATGGVSSVTVPVQGFPMTVTAPTDFAGNFSAPGAQVGILEAAFNLKAIITPIAFLGMEGIVQLNAAVVPAIEARMNDAGNGAADYIATQIWTNGTAQTINIDGFPLMTDNTQTYGNIGSRIPAQTNDFFAAFNRVVGSSVTVTRSSVIADIVFAANFAGGEMPNMGVAGPGTWVALAQNFTGVESYQITPGNSFDQSNLGARALFTAIMVAGVPIYMDPKCPEGQFIYINTRYLSFYIHEAAAFVFTGFASTLPNSQLGYIGCLVAVLEFICAKPKTLAKVTGYLPAS